MLLYNTNKAIVMYSTYNLDYTTSTTIRYTLKINCTDYINCWTSR